MEPGQDPDDLFSVLDERRDLLEEMGQTAHDERYEDIILQAIPSEYERVRTASYERQDFGAGRHSTHGTHYIGRQPSRSFNSKPVAGRGVAVQVVGDNSSDLKCNYCKGVGHVTQD